MKPEILEKLDSTALFELLPDFLANYAERGETEAIRALLADWSVDDARSLHALLLTLGKEHRVYDAHDRCRQLARDYMRFVFPELTLSGADFLRRALQDGPTVIVTNHLSYIDAMATDAALAWSGNSDLADRIVYVAGPKVYQDLFRLLAAASIHNLPVPQSTRLQHTADLSPREMMRRVKTSLEASHGTLADGRAVLLYPEGSRSRDGRMGPFFQATRRYVQQAHYLVPAAITGTDKAMPLGDGKLGVASLGLVFAPPIPLSGISGREALEQAHRAIDTMLPRDLRPDPEASRLC